MMRGDGRGVMIRVDQRGGEGSDDGRVGERRDRN